MTPLVHHGTAIRFVCDQLWNSIHDEIGTVEDDRAERLRVSVLPVVPGASIILACSYLERCVFELKQTVPDSRLQANEQIPNVAELREWQRYFSLPVPWDGWYELSNFFRIRHCFAHEFGRATVRQKRHIESFLLELQNGSVREEGTVIDPYFILVNDEISMLEGWNNRLRRRTVGFLRLFDAHGFRLTQ